MCISLADDHPHWTAEDGSAPSASASGEKNRQILGIRSSRAGTADVHIRSHCALAGLHLVRDSKCRKGSRNLIGSYAVHRSTSRYAIGNAERPILNGRIGWLDALATDTNQHYTVNGTGGPSIKV